VKLKNYDEEMEGKETPFDKELAQLYSDSIAEIKEGEIVKGTVVQI